MTQDMWAYLTFWDDMAVIFGVIFKGRHVVIPESLKKQALQQFHGNHMETEKTKLLTWKSIYWTKINDDVEKYIKLLYTSWFTANTTKRKDNIPQNPS